jgi:hypothetical protein
VTFTFDAENHRYELDGEILPSITNILRPLYEANLSQINPDVLEAARLRGVQVHLSIERYSKGECDEFESNYTMAWHKFVVATGFKAEIVEVPTYHPTLKYGCIPDVLGRLPDGRQMLVDLKTGGKYKWHTCQTAGQAMALSYHGMCDMSVLRANVHLFEKNGEWAYSIDEHPNARDFKFLFNFINYERMKEDYM